MSNLKLHTIEGIRNKLQQTRDWALFALRFETNEKRKKELEDMLLELQNIEKEMDQRFGDRKGYY